MMRSKARIALLPACLPLVAVMLVGCQSMRDDEEVIRERLLRRTPLGTSFEQTLQEVQREGWKSGFDQHSGGEGYVNGRIRRLGKRTVWAQIGDYWTAPFVHVFVFAYWAFDEQGRLFELWVDKSALAL